MNESNLFPEQAGLYVVQRGTDIVLLKVTGIYPMLQISRGFTIDTLLTGQQLKEASKEILANVEINPTKWKWQELKVNTSVFPKITFDSDLTHVALSTEEYLSIRSRYYRLCQQGVSQSKITRALMYEYKLTMGAAIDLKREFDADLPTVSSDEYYANT